MKSPFLIFSCRISVSITSAAALTMGPGVHAADATWNLNNVGGWVTDGNWSPAAAPGATSGTTNADTATFGTVINAARIITVDANRNIFGIDFAANSSAYTLSGGTLVLTSGGTLQTSGGGSTHTDTVSSAITLGGNYTFATNSTTAGRILSIGTTVTSAEITGTTTLSLSGVGTSSSNAITGIISNGTGTNKMALSKSGTGTWALSGANTFTGDITLTSGVLRGLNATATDVLTAFGSGNTIFHNGGTLQLLANGSGNSKTIVASNNVTTGATAATIHVDRNSANAQNSISLTNLSLGTGQLNVTGGNQYNLKFSGSTTLTGNATINTTTSGLTLVGAVGETGGSFGITKLGAASGFVSTQVGNLVLSGTNTYRGVTAVLEGILQVASNAPSGSNGALGNATSAVLIGNTSGNVNAYLNASNVTIGRDVTVQSGNTGKAYIGSNSSSGSNTYSGNITLGSDGLAGHDVTIFTGSNHTQTISGVIQDSASLAGTAGIVTFGDVTTANFLTGTFSPNPSNGGSIAVLSNANTYTGGTVVDTAGAVRISNANAFGTGNLSILRGTIQGNGTAVLAGISGQTWDGNFSVNSFTFGGQGAVNLGTSAISLTGNRTVTVANGTSTIGGVISGSGRSLQLNGSGSTASALQLNGASSFDGGLIVAGVSGSSLTAVSGHASALGTGQLNLTNSANSRVSLGADTTVGSLTSGINNSITSFTGGTSGLTAGTYALTITGTGTGAAGTATVNASGVVTAVSLSSLGTDYTSAPVISLASSSATFTPQTFGASSINLNPGTARTLTISGNNASPATFAGIIYGAGGNLVKNGSGTQTLAGVNTYTGSTTINGGTLALDSTGSINNTSGVSLGTGGTFDVSEKGGYTVSHLTGSGDVIGSLTVSTQLAIGNSPGTTTFDDLTLGAASVYIYELIGGLAPGDGSADLGVVNGDLTLVSGAVLDLVQLGGYTAGNKFTLFAYTGTLSGIFKDTATADLADGDTFTDASGLWTIDYNDTTAGLNGGTTVGASYVTITAVPEPRAALLGGLGLLALLRRRR